MTGLNALITKQSASVNEVSKSVDPAPEPVVPTASVTAENAQLTDFDPIEVRTTYFKKQLITKNRLPANYALFVRTCSARSSHVT